MSHYSMIARARPDAHDNFIRARVVTKNDIKRCGGGAYLQVILADDRGIYPATFWDGLASQAKAILREGEVYDFYGGWVKDAGDWKTPDWDCWVAFRPWCPPPRAAPDFDPPLPGIESRLFCIFAELADVPRLSRVAIEGRVTAVSKLRHWNDQPLRDVTIADRANATVVVTFWRGQVDLVAASAVGRTLRLHELSVKSRIALSSTSFTVVRRAQ